MIKKKTKIGSPTNRSGILTPEEAMKKNSERKVRTPNVMKGQKYVLNTGPTLNHFEIHQIGSFSEVEMKGEVPLEKILSMLLLAQSALPNQYITSNKAEVFNALHDRFNDYNGRKSFSHANRDLLAWVVMTFYPEQAKRYITRHEWLIPQHLLSKLFPLMISKVEWQ